ncbi:hypothetical protein CHS0354_033830 [Potamilus streckersoni]|uniref:BTB domain-containing protein n=1 Tax=Potamilus streckersoni TaxID=2493646 RepID=A0AAE0W8F7_9BIVA|nr:hypothetical protein CHS0354_033830 [Potamilus streckersoni]
MEAKATELAIGWQTEQSLSQSVCTLLEKGTMDRQVVELKAHTLILAARNPVFQAMFFGQIDSKREVAMVDVSPESFRLFLKCLYTDNVDLDEDSLTQVIKLAHKYQVNHLLAECAERLAKRICVENACQILNVSVFYDLTKLKEIACIFVDDNVDEILESVGFMDIPVETLKVILSGDSFYANEMKIVKKCLEWAENKCKQQCLELNSINKRRVLDGAFYFLRLTSLSLSDFTEYVVKTSLLDQDESFKIYLHMGSPSSQIDIGNSIIPRKPRLVKFPFAECQNQIILEYPHDIYLEGIDLHPSETIYQQGQCSLVQSALYSTIFCGQILIKELALTVAFQASAYKKSPDVITLKERVFLPRDKGPYNLTVEMSCFTAYDAAFLENVRKNARSYKPSAFVFSNYRNIIKALVCANVSNR